MGGQWEGHGELSYEVRQQAAGESSRQRERLRCGQPVLPRAPTLGVLCLEDVPGEMLGFLPSW